MIDESAASLSIGEGIGGVSRRDFLRKSVSAALVTSVAASGCRRRVNANRTVKIGYVAPKTGALAAFSDADAFVVDGIRRAIGSGITIAGRFHPVEIIMKDSRSDPNRAAEVASDLIKTEEVDLIMAAATAETVSPVADQAEINGVPCVTTDAPWQAYFFGRGGKADQPFEWTYHFFWGSEDLAAVYTNLWQSIPNNKVVGALWGNDNEGNAFSDSQTGFPPVLAAKGFKLVDTGRFQPTTTDFSAQIIEFKKNEVEILTGVLTPPSFATFWSQAAQQGFRPRIVTVAKALLFPTAVESLGNRAGGLTTEVWWSPHHPYRSSVTGHTAAELCAEYERQTGKQWIQPMGFRNALFSVALDILQRTTDIDSPESIRDAIRATSYESIVGHLAWKKGPVANVCRTPLVGGQWIPGNQSHYSLVIVNDEGVKEIPTQAQLQPMNYAGA